MKKNAIQQLRQYSIMGIATVCFILVPVIIYAQQTGSPDGNNHSVVVSKDGTVQTWGDGRYGQMGDGTTNGSLVPIQVPNLVNVTQVAAGSDFSVALLCDGTVKTWGVDIRDPNRAFFTTPTTVAGITDAIAITAGWDFGAALLSDGTVKYWGTMNPNPTPSDFLPPTIVGNLTNVKSISAGSDHCIALLNDGTVKAWGYSYAGCLGDGTNNNSYTTAVVVQGLSNVKQVVAGCLHNIALLNNGTLKAWGWNSNGQIGDGTKSNRNTPVTVSGGLQNIIDIAAGGACSFALSNTGQLYVWGDNDHGVFGICPGGATNQKTPLAGPKLSGPASLIMPSVSQHLLAIFPDGTAKIWGDNEYGCLGINSTNDQCTPVNPLLIKLVTKGFNTPFGTILGSQSQTTEITGLQNYSGSYRVLGNLVFKDAKVTLSPGTVFYVDGYPARPSYTSIYLDGATSFTMTDATITSSCATTWGSLESDFYLSNTTLKNNINITGTGNNYSELSNCLVCLDIDDSTINFKVDRTHFTSTGAGIYYGNPSRRNSPSQCSITNSVFDGIDHNSMNLAGNIDNLTIQYNTMNDAYSGISIKGDWKDNLIIDQNTINNTEHGILALPYGSGGSFDYNHKTIKLTNNTFNFPADKEATGIFVLSTGFLAEGNIFNGNPGTSGVVQTGILHNIYVDKNGITIHKNQFSKLTYGINNLVFKYQASDGTHVSENTFTSVQNSFFVDNNDDPSIVPAPADVHCNNFDKGTASLAGGVAAIRLGSKGKLGNMGTASAGGAEGNKYIGYSNAPDWGIENQNPTKKPTYYRSVKEASGTNWGRVNSLKVNFVDGYTSGCGSIGQQVVVIKPTLAEVLIAIQQLKRGLIDVQKETELLLTIIRYYAGNCGPEYQNVVSQMLPYNLRAYTALGWNLADCYLASGNTLPTVQMMQELVYNNPGDVEVLQRSNFYNAMLSLHPDNTSASVSVNPGAISLLAQVASSGTMYASSACYTLQVVDPQNNWGHCTSVNNATVAARKARETAQTVITHPATIFIAMPNPFNSSTTIGYSLPEGTQTAILKVYNMQGQTVKTVQLSVQGTETMLNADELPNGVYLYTIETDGTAAQPQRLVIIK